MECLIQDFPFSSGTFDESMNASKAATNLDESQNIDKATTVINQDDQQNCIVKQRIIQAKIKFDGFNYKMRVRKEESVVKVIDFSIDFVDKMHSEKTDERELQCELSDFQVLH